MQAAIGLYSAALIDGRCREFQARRHGGWILGVLHELVSRGMCWIRQVEITVVEGGQLEVVGIGVNDFHIIELPEVVKSIKHKAYAHGRLIGHVVGNLNDVHVVERSGIRYAGIGEDGPPCETIGGDFNTRSSLECFEVLVELKCDASIVGQVDNG